MNRAGGWRLAGALLRDGRKAFLAAPGESHPAHRAMVLAVSPAAGGQVRVGIAAK